MSILAMARERALNWRAWSLGLAGFSLIYLLALDQGLLMSLFQGAAAFDQNLIHEFLHDGRHLLGVPCH